MDRTDGIGICSITVHLKQTSGVSGGGVLFEACRVGTVNESDGTMMLNWDLGELTILRPSVSTERVTKELTQMLFGKRTGEMGNSGIGTDPAADLATEIRRSVTGPDGTCTFRDLDEGVWLIHASESSSYGRIEDVLTAVPCYVQEGETWKGPEYEQDIWPKGEIYTKSTEDVRQTEKMKDPPRRETEKASVTKKTFETGSTESIREKSKHPETEKNPKKTVPGITTAGRTEIVRTLDDTPLSGLVCTFLICALIIGGIAVRLRNGGRKRRRNRMSEQKTAAVRQNTEKGKNSETKTLSVLALILGTGVIFTSGCVTSAYAAQNGDLEQILEGERKIVFVNESPSVPSLSVAKEVLDAAGGSRAPEGDRFTFLLTIDNERASGVRYRMFNEDGTELVDMTGNGEESLVPAESAAGDPVALRTGRDGSFTLSGGQYALFEDVSAGQLWEVRELPSDRYERVQPKSGGTVSGTIERNGSHAQFVNRYDPGEDPGYTEGVLEITKEILWPENCSLPDQGSFRVRVLVDGKAWSNAPAELTAAADGAVTEHVRTDENGVFSIRGNQKALLKSIPLGSDVFVEEIDDPEDAFIPSGDTEWKGAAASRMRVAFTNRLADFVVAKSLRSGDPQDTFLFCLSGDQNHPLAGVSYYVVLEDGNLAFPEPLMTDAEGHFSICAGERAIFTGMPEGKRYSVREEKILGYRQVSPEADDGYTGLFVRNSVPTLLFENEKTDVRMFLPSSGGSGILFSLAAAIAGMSVCLAFLARRKISV